MRAEDVMTKAKARKLLEEERSRLQEIREGIHREGSGADGDGGELSSIDQHPGDLGSETFEHEKNLSVLEQVNDELLQIEAALHRLEQGTYGTCQACGRKIAEERLEALPATRFCVDDQAKAERELGLPGTRA
jgi:RNA polymerase-binding transcription factor DksA